MSKKLIFSLFALSILFFGCKKNGMITDMKELISENIKIHEEFQSAIELSKNGKDVAAAIDKFADSTVLLSKKSLELEKKYPSIKEKSDYPELEEVHTKMMQVSKKISKNMTVVMQKYKDDKDVKRAMDDLANRLMRPVEEPDVKK